MHDMHMLVDHGLEKSWSDVLVGGGDGAAAKIFEK